MWHQGTVMGYRREEDLTSLSFSTMAIATKPFLKRISRAITTVLLHSVNRLSSLGC